MKIKALLKRIRKERIISLGIQRKQQKNILLKFISLYRKAYGAAKSFLAVLNCIFISGDSNTIFSLPKKKKKNQKIIKRFSVFWQSGNINVLNDPKLQTQLQKETLLFFFFNLRRKIEIT